MLKAHQGEPLADKAKDMDEEFGAKFGVKFGVNEKRVLLLLDSDPALSATEIAEKTGFSAC